MGLNFLHGILLRLHRSSLKSPSLWLTGVAVLVIFSLGALSKLQMLLSIDDLIDTDFKTYAGLLNLNSSFGDKNNMFLVVAPKDDAQIISKSALCDLQIWIQSIVNERHDVSKIMSAFGARTAKSDGTHLNFPRILDVHCENPHDPETANIKDELRRLHESPWGRTLTSHNANDVALNIYIVDTLEDKRMGSFDTKIVKSIMDSFEMRYLAKHRELKAAWGGVGVYQFYLRRGYDLTGLLNIGTVFLILITFRLLYGTFKTAWLFIFTILVAVIPIYGGLALTGCPIDVLTNILSLMLIVASLEDFMFLAYIQAHGQTQGSGNDQTREAGDTNKRSGGLWKRPFRKLLMPSFFTSLTTLIGFGSLLTADLGIIRRFGGWAAVAALLEWIMIYCFLPALLQVFPKLRPAPPVSKTKLSRWTEKLKLLCPPRWISIAALSAYIIGAVGAFHLRVSDSPPRVFPSGHIVRYDLKEIETSRGWQTEISLVFAQYSNREQNEKVITAFSNSPLVGAVEDPYVIEDFLTQNLPDSRAAWVKDNWTETSAGQRLFSDARQPRALIYLKDTDIAGINTLRAQAEKLCPHQECELAGSLVSYGEFGDRVLGTLLSSLGLSLALVSLVLIWLLWVRGVKQKFKILASALWGPAALLSAFFIFDIPIFYVTSMFASILVGLAGDNTIQYIFASRKGQIDDGISRTGGASVQVSLAMMVISTIFFAAYFEPLRILGLLLIAGFFLSLVGDLWLLKGLTRRKLNNFEPSR